LAHANGALTRVRSYASRYLLELLKQEKPEQYKQLQTGLFTKAQQSNDETILDNPYLQMRSILDAKVPALLPSASSAALPVDKIPSNVAAAATGASPAK